MELGLKDKIALVTGGSYGIGRAIALALAKEGCRVAICARGAERLEEAAARIRASGAKALAIVADATGEDAAHMVIDRVVGEWGGLQILVNNVGGGGEGVEKRNVEEVPEQKWLEAYQRNVLATRKFTMQALPYMRRSKWGRVVSIASRQGKEGGGRPWYTMAKSAEISLMKTLAMNPDLARSGITFNSVAPGRIVFEGSDWDQFRRQDPGRFAQSMDRLPLGRAGTPEEAAAAVVFACSEPASLLNGACISVDGGESHSF